MPGNYQHVLARYRNGKPSYVDLARYLVSLNQVNDFDRKLDINYDLVRKGIYCEKCHQPLVKISQRQYSCEKCTQVYSTDQVVIHQLNVYHHIWADRPLTAKTAYEWMGEQISFRTLQRILAK